MKDRSFSGFRNCPQDNLKADCVRFNYKMNSWYILYISQLLEQRFDSFFAPVMNPENKVKFPLWQYLNQPLLSSQLVLNPRRFAHLYRVELLTRCWRKECDAKGSQQNWYKSII